MRRIGNLPDTSLAERFCDYLVTHSIHATWEQSGGEGDGSCDIWIRDESDLQRAREVLGEFQQSPHHDKYDVQEKAAQLREERAAENARRLKNQRNFGKSMASPVPRGGGLTGGMSGGMGRQQSIPITVAIIVLSVLASLGTNFGQLRIPRVEPNRADALSTQVKLFLGLSFVNAYEYAPERDSFASIRQGEIWRFVTPMFLHGSPLHLVFNMLWIYSLGSVIERYHGSLIFIALLLGTEIAGMMLQVLLPDTLPSALRGSPFAIGASGAVYGLLGFLWIRPRIEPMYPIRLPPMTLALMLGWLVLCLTPVIPGVANGAHIGGLLGGTAAAAAWPRSV